MNSFFSFYLNTLRLLAATAVFIFHFGSIFNQSPFDIGHPAVVVFFVVSGFVIAYTTFNKNKGYKQYSIDRISRLYSVIVPALLITFVINLIGYIINPIYYRYAEPSSLMYYGRYVIAFFNMQQTWFFSSNIQHNTPFWSLAYEFWYYVLFGFFIYITSIRWKVLAIVLCMILIGPKILLLLPCWLIGVICFYLSQKELNMSKNINGILFVLAFVLFVVIYFEILPPLFVKGDSGTAPLYFSSDFMNDYILAIIIGINLFFAKNIQFDMSNNLLVKFVDYTVNGTFILYLIHAPIMILIYVLFPDLYSNKINLLLSGAILYAVLIIIGNVIESKRFWLKKKINYLLEK